MAGDGQRLVDYQMTISRGQMPVGMTVQQLETSLQVVAIKAEGPASAWNQENASAPTRQLRVGDQILSINGVSGDPTAMSDLLQTEARLALDIKSRPYDPQVPAGDLSVTLLRTTPQQTIGLSIRAEEDSHLVTVYQVKPDGLVPDWNRRYINSPTMLVQDGDVIISVNDVRGDYQKMIVEFSKSMVNLILQHSREQPIKDFPEAVLPGLDSQGFQNYSKETAPRIQDPAQELHPPPWPTLAAEPEVPVPSKKGFATVAASVAIHKDESNVAVTADASELKQAEQHCFSCC
eukprot:TRINITY_DN21805_c0_g1_i2.p1 TRINITY_DN21805_c0_g1~~TRINITY_DN21805_c0_g1_i2.p1  ORF type:complete len:291 (+),score=42.04 TRINITY_DN21805_c0_g1_i2:150-1022(+)